MIIDNRTELIACPYCFKSESSLWATENGFTAVKCSECGLVYVNPRPVEELIGNAVETGIHSNVGHNRTAIARRERSKKKRYKKILSSIFRDVWQNHRKISWLDVGAGYGEILQAICLLAEPGSRIEGIEPMKPKVKKARELGLNINNKYLHDILHDIKDKYDYISLIHVYSHIPDFRKYLKEMKNILEITASCVLKPVI